MEEYARVILKVDEKSMDEHTKIATYFEDKKKYGKSAIHYEKCENYKKALKFYIQEGEEYIP